MRRWLFVMPDPSEPESSPPPFTYSNLSGRRPGAFVTVAGLVVPGVSRVQRQVAPFAGAWRRDNEVAIAGSTPLWVALGDSLTLGIGASAHDRGWVGQLRSTLARHGRDYAVVNLGVSGAKTQDVLERQVPALESLASRVALVTLMIGSNDLMRPANRRLLPARIHQLLLRLPAGAVVTTLPNPSRPADAANEVIAQVAAERDLVVADLRDPRLASWRGKLAADHFHPNDRGYAGLATVIGEVLGT